MQLYLLQAEVCKPTKTATQKTGAQLNAEPEAKGEVKAYDPKAILMRTQ